MKTFIPYFKLLVFYCTLLMHCILFGQSIASYDITFTSFWNSTDHGTLPTNAHWSSLVGATHQTANEFLEIGNKATLGIEQVAEDGANATFQTEVNSNPDANQFINGGGLGAGSGTISINNLEINEDFPLLTLVSMIAPSPDWFITVNSLNLRSNNPSINNGWKDTFTVDLFPYDAGTEEGTMYNVSNPATTPQENISSLISITPFNANKIGTMTLTYKSSVLSTAAIDSFKDVKVFPNPTQGKITISSITNLELKTVDIYTVYGKLIKQIHPKSEVSKIEIDVSNLSKSIYLLSLTTIDGFSKTQKLLVQ